MSVMSSSAPLRFLLIAATFPPRGGSSVQRAAKFAKYARRAGHEPVVLTTSYHGSLSDETLLQDLPADLEVHRVAPEPVNRGRVERMLSRFAYPDAYRAWGRKAEKAGAKLLATDTFDAIFVSFGMPSALLAGARLARRFDLPLVLDIRDFWTITRRGNRRHQLGPLLAPLDRLVEQRAWRAVDRFVVVSQGYAETLHKAYGIATDRIDVIYNGYDPEDVAGLAANAPITGEEAGPVIGFAGFVTERVALRNLFKAMMKLNEHRVQKGEAPVRLHIIGGTPKSSIRAELDGADWPQWLRSEGYKSHEEALRFMRAMNILLLLQPYEHGMLTGKFFEYSGVRRPILHMDNGTAELRELIARHRLGLSVDQGDAEAAADGIEQLLGWRDELAVPPEPFRRDHQAEQFIGAIAAAIAARQGEKTDAEA